MALPALLRDSLSIPVVGAPLFIVSLRSFFVCVLVS